MTAQDQPALDGLARLSLTSANAVGLAAFYENAFGCRRLTTERLSGLDFERLMGVRGGALRITLSLGREVIELLQFDQPGRPYPKMTLASDLVFQHFAIVVNNMADAYQHLSTVAGWTPISCDGPRRLPESSGGVTAFKFRDPEGHPLELLRFPTDNMPLVWRSGPDCDACLGIDHSAIGVSDTARSIAFYENLGFAVASRSLNRGLEQEMLDNVADVQVEVTALKASEASPHLELLCYRTAAQDRATIRSNADVATTRVLLRADAVAYKAGRSGASDLMDPDNHHLIIVAPDNSAIASWR